MLDYHVSHDIELSREFTKSPELVSYLISMDRLLIEDEIIDKFGYRTAIEKLFGKGVEHLGHLVANTAESLHSEYGLGAKKIKTIDKFVHGQGLSLGSNNSLWKRYRATVPPLFRILRGKAPGEHALA
jgi:hypothetical protein